MRILYNNCYGGFGLSVKAIIMYLEAILHKQVFAYDSTHKKIADVSSASTVDPYWCIFVTDTNMIPDHDLTLSDRKTLDEYSKHHLDDKMSDISFRKDPVLIAIFDKIGSDEFSGSCARIEADTVPDGSLYAITEHDGLETVEYRYADDWCYAGNTDTAACVTRCCACLNYADCGSSGTCKVWNKAVYPDDFCSRAEKKNDQTYQC